MELAGQTLHVNGLDLNVVIVGQGPDVMLVHGFPDTHAVWRKQIPPLVAAGYRVIAPDLRGFGESEAPRETSAYRVDHLVDDLVGLLERLDIERVRLIGHDWGSIVGWQLCMRSPERVDRFVALSVGHPSAYARGGVKQKLKAYYILFAQARSLPEFLLRLGDWWLLRLMTRHHEEFERWRAALSSPGRLTAALGVYRANLGLFVRRTHPPVRVPVLGIWSSRDIALAEQQMTLSEGYVAARWQYVRIDGASHWLQLDVPEQVSRLLLDFLR